MYKYIDLMSPNNIILYRILKVSTNFYQVIDALKSEIKEVETKLEVLELINFNLIENRSQVENAVINL